MQPTFNVETIHLLVRDMGTYTLRGALHDRHHNMVYVCVNCGLPWLRALVEGRTTFSSYVAACQKCANDFPYPLQPFVPDSLDPETLPDDLLPLHFLAQYTLEVEQKSPNISNYTKGVLK